MWWAATETERTCTSHSNEYIYSYNKAYRPHRLTNESVYYTLSCQVDNCTDNESIANLSKMARHFAENSWSPAQKELFRKTNSNKSQHSAPNFSIYISILFFSAFL
ncbi:unnamed protein product [Adineta steineri]|uniref:Uncharacterized protein n=1 Tax=Adineta steineri TaxID=433720 RepID=A0A813YVY1_9BILA|nr:unnamed protein product [Adineta steineri]